MNNKESWRERMGRFDDTICDCGYGEDCSKISVFHRTIESIVASVREETEREVREEYKDCWCKRKFDDSHPL